MFKKWSQIALDYRKIGIEIYFLGPMKKLIHEKNTKKFNNFLNKKFTKVCEVVGSQSVRSRSVRSRNRSVRIEVACSQSVLVPIFVIKIDFFIIENR